MDVGALLNQLHERVDANEKLVLFLKEQNEGLVAELTSLRRAFNRLSHRGKAWEQVVELERELVRTETERDAYRTSLGAFQGGRDGAEKLAQFVTEKVRALACPLLWGTVSHCVSWRPLPRFQWLPRSETPRTRNSTSCTLPLSSCASRGEELRSHLRLEELAVQVLTFGRKMMGNSPSRNTSSTESTQGRSRRKMMRQFAPRIICDKRYLLFRHARD